MLRPVVPDDHVAVFSERQFSAADCLPQFARDGLQLGQLKLGGGIAVRRCGRRLPVAVESCEQPAEQVGLEVLGLYADFAASAEVCPAEVAGLAVHEPRGQPDLASELIRSLQVPEPYRSALIAQGLVTVSAQALRGTGLAIRGLNDFGRRLLQWVREAS